MHKFRLFPQGTAEELQGIEEHVHVLSPPCVKQSLLLPTPSSASSNKRQHAMWLLMEGKTHVYSIIYLATETSFDLREVTFSSFPMCAVGVLNVFLPHGDTHPILQ